MLQWCMENSTVFQNIVRPQQIYFPVASIAVCAASPAPEIVKELLVFITGYLQMHGQKRTFIAETNCCSTVMNSNFSSYSWHSIIIYAF